ncbi:MAG TPA: PAS domain-containing protein, partial [Ignavibacteriaceae bacterium]|nr:PAS domain-containing protein [Ignavibacteriaceae bacterium]
METVNKINIKLFNSLKENLKYPFLVLNHKGDILFSNNEASLLLSINQKEDNIFNLFEEVSSTKFKNLVEEVYISNKSISNEILIQLSEGNSFNAQVTASAYKEDEEFFVFCTLKPLDLKLGVLGQTLISSKINSDSINDLISNQKIKELLNEIKSLYPFTFIGKERLSNDLNKLDELFWIKTVEGKFAIANKSLTNLIGLGQSQIEGKSVRNFLPLFLNALLDTIENYIKDTLNSVSIKGIPVFGISDPSDKEAV